MTDESNWTVRDRDGLTHRAVRQHASPTMYVVTLCDWWQTHNVQGEKAHVRLDQTPTCMMCMLLELAKLGLLDAAPE